MKIVTKKKQKELDEMMIKKLRFVALATLQTAFSDGEVIKKEKKNWIKIVMDNAEQVFYADDVM